MARTNAPVISKTRAQKIDLKAAYAVLIREYLHREQAKAQQPPNA